MKKPLLAAGLASFMMLGACGVNNAGESVDNNQGTLHKNGNTLNVRDREDLYNGDRNINMLSDERAESFGYVRQQQSPIKGETISYKDMYTMDREQTADAISKLSVGLPEVNDASVLVTDEEVLIAYDTDVKTDKERSRVADQAKKTAMSIVPRWYHVYVTDNTALRRDIENISKMDAAMDGANDTIDRTIKLMKKSSPQGERVTEGENANGEMKHDTMR